MTSKQSTLRSTVIAAAVAAAMGASASAHALNLVATLYGVYDPNACGDNASCVAGTSSNPLAAGLASNGGNPYDTPSVFINNDTGFAFTNAQMVLTAYQGINAGSTTTVSIGTIAANTLYVENWGFNTAGTHNPVPAGGSNTSADLFNYDYDDYYGGNSGNPLCVVGASFCESPGNFNVTFTAMWNGTPIFAQFSPDNTQFGGNGNVAGTFVGWEGLNPTGLAETIYDNHTGAVAGVLQYIYTGTPPSVPEPASLGLLGVGLGALGMARRRRKLA